MSQARVCSLEFSEWDSVGAADCLRPWPEFNTKLNLGLQFSTKTLNLTLNPNS